MPCLCSWMDLLTLLISRRSLKEFGVTPYPVTAHHSSSPQDMEKRTQGGQTESLNKCLWEKTPPELPKRKHNEHLYGTCDLYVK